MADPADSTDSATPRRSRGAGNAPRKRRAAAASSSASSISAETENKLARAVQSAQRLAQLSDVPRDDSTLDLFPDDPTRALVESMTIDVRQGTLSGFELPAVVRAAVEAAHGANPAPAPVVSKRAGRSKGTAASAVEDGAVAGSAPAADRAAMSDGVPAAVAGTTVESALAADVASAEGAATTPASDLYEAGLGVADAGRAAGTAANDARTAVSGRDEEAEVGLAVEPVGPKGSSIPGASSAMTDADASIDAPMSPARAAAEARAARASVARSDAVAGTEAAPLSATEAGAGSTRKAGDPAVPPVSRAVRAPVASSPELDRARATAFADTVDALYGVIADQRRAAADLTRRMKWMLAIVAGALLVTVGVGITQTLLLSRLARDAAAQQQRTERLLQTQQAALAGVLERVAASAPAAAAPTVAAPAHPASPAQPAATAATAAPAAPAPAARHPSHRRHLHSPAR
jgi:hypothetical protein